MRTAAYAVRTFRTCVVGFCRGKPREDAGVVSSEVSVFAKRRPYYRPVTADDLRILPATESDTATILRMIRGLAEYEGMSDRVVATEDALREQLFGPRPAAEVSLAVVGDDAVGFAVYFPSFSTFACRPGLYLEDLFIEPKWRGRGFGRQLLAHVAKIAVQRGCDRMNWVVLPWNTPALDFYRRLGAEKITEWDGFGIAGEPLQRLARLTTREGISESPDP